MAFIRTHLLGFDVMVSARSEDNSVFPVEVGPQDAAVADVECVSRAIQGRTS
ncbi:hypothetical protein [Mycobacterium intracellulare]|uniref:hypothetical protein n=1 Tax=Mycobacterium intracellulare TaxID=1767 RepID=UPI001447D0CF|nr:hypothetical protein [Mycobacterium intracellulare]